MKYLLDTNHWSFIQRREPSVLARISQLDDDSELMMPVVAQAELLAGIEVLPDGKRKAELHCLYQEVLAEATEIVGIDSAVAEHFAEVFAQLKSAGKPIPTNDLWMAATALAHDCTLVARDSHYAAISGLRVETWMA